ncbi:MAG: hypothetical protein ABIJ56_02960 [Pseudomonadota bacterium]
MKKLSIFPVLAVFFAAAAGAGCTQFFKYPDNVGPEDGVADSDDDTGDAQPDTQDDDVDDGADDVRTDDAGGDDQPGDATDVQVDDAADVEVEPGECGDGNKDDGEECDDGNDIAGDGCENDCTWTCEENADCRDDELCNGEETCNTGSHTCRDADDLEDGFVCVDDPRSICLDGVCEESECGDGFVDTGGGEQCEPPDAGSCNSECVLECEDNEDCPDDGNACNGTEYCNTDENVCAHVDPLSDGTVCGSDPRLICLSETCQESMCGDSFIDEGADPVEECDDGDVEEGDGCDNDCMYSCHEETQEIECDDLLGCTLDACNTSSHTCDHHTMVESTVCRPAADLCDAVETCNGTDAACPSDDFEPDTHVCRDADGDCDAAETCTGSGIECPDNGYLDNTFECREEAGDCDLPENCPGDGPDCTIDEFLAHTVECRASAGDCDVAEDCTGSSAACPANAFLPDTTVCRVAAGDCDTAENCPGNDTDCPADAFKTADEVCRPAVNDCDIAENCPGGAINCPDNVYVAEGIDCDDGNDCTADDECNGSGLCTGSELTEMVNVVDVGMGGYHGCAVLDGGKLKCWGRNHSYQIGDGSSMDRFAPVEITGIGSLAETVSGGDSHTCAVLDTGGVQCWGSNSDGQLGDSSTTSKALPTDVTGLPSAVQEVSLGAFHSCVLLETGGVMCWGRNEDGQVGNGGTDDELVPVFVTGLGTGASAITAGRYHTCALVSGSVKCWGRNTYGQLGDGTTEGKLMPVDVTGLGGTVTAMAAGMNHTCALLSTGGMQCWGLNNSGQLGNGSGGWEETPVDVPGMTASVTSIATGDFHTCGLHATEGLKCWGYNIHGQVGDGTVFSSTSPLAVYGMASGAIRVFGAADQSCALMDTSKLTCWGYNAWAQLGNGASAKMTAPTAVAGLSDAEEVIGAGPGISCATTSTDFLCWGTNEWWQIGDGTQFNTRAPTSVTGLSKDVIDVSGGGYHMCAVDDPDSDGKGAAKCWGRNYKGQLGDGTTVDKTTPTQVSGLTDHVRSISAGGTHTCALVDTDGDTIGGAKCWGYNYDGELGDGSGSDQHSPVDVSGLTEAEGVLDVQGGWVHTCALTDEGGVKCWGYGNDGRIGNGSTDHQATPVDVTGLGSGVAALVVGEAFACALLDTGAVMCWGENGGGQLGDGTSTDKSTPVQVWGYGADSGVVTIVAGKEHACAILDTGAAQCWGRNTYGQLGDGTVNRKTSPVNVLGLPETPTMLTCGKDQTCGLFSTIGAMCWGGDNMGETTGFFPGYPRFVTCD